MRRLDTFNLSILECKWFYVGVLVQILQPFNLSILECKSGNITFGYYKLRLLISPYWNVNQSPQSPLFPQYTPFNLSILECKWYVLRSPNRRSVAFNLSILECKLKLHIGDCDKAITFNLSILECKCYKKGPYRR